jgi:hypothetical protein
MLKIEKVGEFSLVCHCWYHVCLEVTLFPNYIELASDNNLKTDGVECFTLPESCDPELFEIQEHYTRPLAFSLVWKPFFNTWIFSSISCTHELMLLYSNNMTLEFNDILKF